MSANRVTIKGKTDHTQLTSIGTNTHAQLDTFKDTTVPTTYAPLASPVFTTQITTPLIYGSSAANGDIKIEGTSDATKTSSYVILQPTSGNVGIGTTTPMSKLSVTGTSANQFALAYDTTNYLTDSVSSTGANTLTLNGSSPNYSIVLPVSALAGINLIPVMTSNTAPSGIAAGVDYDATDHAAWKAFDGSLDIANFHHWTSSSIISWLSYQFTTSQTITQYKLYSANYPTYAPKNWTFEGYNGSSWVVLDTQTNQTNWTTWNTYSFTNTTAYISYRINITANNGAASYDIIDEMQMFATGAANASMLTISNTGVVGINNAAPAYTLDVKGLAGASPFNVASSTGTSELMVSSTGNIGIGTTNPQTKLALSVNSAISFEASAGVTDMSITHSADTLTLSGGNLALSTNSLTLTGSIGATGARATKLWATDIESTNMPTVGGTSIASTFAPIASPTFTGTVTIPTPFTLGAVSVLPTGTELNYVDGVTSAIQTQLDTKAPSASPTFTGATVQSGYVDLDLPASDHTATGTTTNAILSGATVAAFQLVFLGTGGKWLLVDADAVATCKGMIGIALEAKNDAQAMLVALPGSFVREDTWAWTTGDTLYAGETAGAIQATIPTGADGVIRVIGFAVSATVIFFNPSSDNSTVVA